MVNVLQGCGKVEAGLSIPSFIGKHTFVLMLNDLQDTPAAEHPGPNSQALNCVYTVHTIHKI